MLYLLKVVGKGAFGKVMLVRKKTSPDKNGIFAMKVLKKSMIIAKGQVEHTASERSILHTIKHPYIVCLRYAFQSDEKLYLITDYYSGGSLFYHLRKARGEYLHPSIHRSIHQSVRCPIGGVNAQHKLKKRKKKT